MNFSIARVVAFDDQEEHLLPLAAGLLMAGMQCTPVRVVDGAVPFLGRVKVGIRLVFLDLELFPGSIVSDQKINFSTCVSVLDSILEEKNGPYFLVLWTTKPSLLDDFKAFINDKEIGFSKVPIETLALSKASVGIGGADNVGSASPEKIAGNISQQVTTMIKEYPAFAALLDWEGKVSEAATKTVNGLAETSGSPPNLAQLLANLGKAYAGKQSSSAPFRSINGAMIPLLLDAMENQTDGNEDIWGNILEGDVNPAWDVVAKLNASLLLDSKKSRVDCRGCASLLDINWLFKKFAMPLQELEKLFSKEPSAPCSPPKFFAVEISPACDFAQDKRRVHRFILGIEILVDNENIAKRTKKKSSGDAVWFSPVLHIDGQNSMLACNCLYLFSMTPEEIENATPLYRLRDNLLDQLIHKVASHSTRVGLVSL
ncbi:MAG: hypothetical protein HW380_731 [Magnetococcales bacterium]|nr:hypothetical protein [Magnetococcales bacterium]HIJ85895.1 hypothetical protein [Magnetococcales bacterium]